MTTAFAGTVALYASILVLGRIAIAPIVAIIAPITSTRVVFAPAAITSVHMVVCQALLMIVRIVANVFIQRSTMFAFVAAKMFTASKTVCVLNVPIHVSTAI